MQTECYNTDYMIPVYLIIESTGSYTILAQIVHSGM
jgi:hypothetical protein